MPNYDLTANPSSYHRYYCTFQRFYPNVYEAPKSYIPAKSTISCYERAFDDLVIDFLRGEINQEVFSKNIKILVKHFAEHAQAQQLKYLLINPFRNVKKVCFTVEKNEGRITNLVIKGTSSKLSQLKVLCSQ